MICVIGGSGFYNFLDDSEIKPIKSPFGVVNVEVGKIQNKDVKTFLSKAKQQSIISIIIGSRSSGYISKTTQCRFCLTAKM